jgi:hypothetical protein
VDVASALAAAVVRLLDDAALAARVAAEAHHQVRGRFAIETMVHKTLTFYN